MTEILSWLITISFTLSLVILNFHILSILKKKENATNPLPPGPKPLPIIGNLLLLGDKPHRSLAKLAKSYGPVMSLKLGQVTTIVISSPGLAREVLMKKDKAFSGRSVACILNHQKISVAWLPPNQQWKNLRSICATQLFTAQRLDCNKGCRQQKVQELVEYLRERARNGEAVNIGQVVFMTMLNLLTNTFFSVDLVDTKFPDSTQGFRDLIREIMQLVGSANVSDFFPMIRGLDLQGKRRKVEGYIKGLFEIIDGFIDQKLNSDTTEKDFLDMLLHCHLNEPEKQLDREVIRSLLVDLLVAGSDTSSNTVEWAMAELLHSPSSMSKIRCEITKALGNEKEIEESDILRLPYLQAVVKETLRLHPPAPFLVPHRTETNIELQGFTIPKHTRVLVNCWAITRDETIWRDADVFMPERFLERDVDFKGRHFEFIPFGSGRRICPGLPLASRMVHHILGSLLQQYDWKLANGMRSEDVDLTEKFGLTLSLATPVEAIPIPSQ